MKKITLSVLLGFFLTFNMYAQFPEGFETAVPPTGWTSFIGTNGEGTTYNWTTTTTAANGSAQAAFVRYEAVANTAEDWLVTPMFTPTAGMPILTFQQRQSFGADYGSTFSVRVSTTSQTDHASFTAVDTYGETDFSTVYGARNVDLTAYVGTSIYVAFVLENNDGDSWYIDEVDMIADASPPNCAMNPTPANGATDVVVDAGAITIAWESAATGDPATSYEVFWGTTSGSLASLGTLSATTVNITGSEYSTTYYWMIVPSNVGGSATGCMEWSFTTEDAPPPPANDLPAGAIALTLDEGTACGANSITGISNSSTTDSGEAAPSCGSYVGTESGDLWYTFMAPASGSLTLNTENVTGLTSVAGAYYSGTPGALVEEGCTEFGSGWPWNLSGLTGGATYYLRVWDYGLDQVGTFDLCGYFQTCPAPTGLTASSITDTSAQFSWTAGGTESQWQVVVLASPSSEPSSGGTVTSPGAGAGSLTADTDYDVWVRSDCGGQFSDWVMITFTTAPAPASVPYSYDFSGFPDMGWTQAGSGDPTTGPTGTTSGWSTQNYANDAASPNGLAGSLNLYSDFQQEWIISNTIDMMAAGTYYLNMDVAVTAWNATGASAMGSDDEVQVLISTDAGASWTNLFTWNAGNAPGNAREAAGEIDISAYAGNNVLIALWGSDGAVDDTEDYDFFVDNLQVTTMPLSTEDVTFEGFKYYPNPVEGTLSLRAQDNIQVVSVYNMLGQEVMRSSPNALEDEVDMSSLQTGAYFLKVRINGVEGNFRIIKE